MKFDTMLCNPPYQLSKNSNFYREFIELSEKIIKDDMIFVTPNRFCMNGSNTTNLINRFQIHHIMWNSSVHFPGVGTFIGSYVASNSDNPDNTAVDIDFGNFSRAVDITAESIPPSPVDNELKLSIIRKYFAYPDKCEIVKRRTDDTVFICRQWASRVSDETVGGLVFNTKNQSSTDGKIYRVVNRDNFIWFVTHSLFMRFIARCFASGMFVAPQIARSIPDIGYDNPRDDQQVFDVFGLTDAEVEYLKTQMYK